MNGQCWLLFLKVGSMLNVGLHLTTLRSRVACSLTEPARCPWNSYFLNNTKYFSQLKGIAMPNEKTWCCSLDQGQGVRLLVLCESYKLWKWKLIMKHFHFNFYFVFYLVTLIYSWKESVDYFLRQAWERVGARTKELTCLEVSARI